MRPLQKAQNNRGVDIRNGSQGQHGKAAQRSAGKNIEKPQKTAFLLLKKNAQSLGIDPRQRNGRPDSIERQHPKGGKNALANIRGFEKVKDLFHELKKAIGRFGGLAHRF